MTVVNVLQLGQRLDTHAVGDKIAAKSVGPILTELDLNTNGFFAYGGSIDLGLIVDNTNKAPPPDPEEPITNEAGYLPRPPVISCDNTRSDASSTVLLPFLCIMSLMTVILPMLQ
ncbi:hypothetical protein BGW38_007249 [Lunasporangiospora selenospora]|uniref:Uncharacterized protein n=1 Tax=Lunasporangiospora selenospora TaxID=979761 RepID=A0A9P6FKW4_9FUNG|nr:hypothetical protein BGW38_007249 [Lunasporangiospora selenospora]